MIFIIFFRGMSMYWMFWLLDMWKSYNPAKSAMRRSWIQSWNRAGNFFLYLTPKCLNVWFSVRLWLKMNTMNVRIIVISTLDVFDNVMFNWKCLLWTVHVERNVRVSGKYYFSFNIFFLQPDVPAQCLIVTSWHPHQQQLQRQFRLIKMKLLWLLTQTPTDIQKGQ